jgi:hypothetical protein
VHSYLWAFHTAGTGAVSHHNYVPIFNSHEQMTHPDGHRQLEQA